jgi:type 1 glutamine amidotransferase
MNVKSMISALVAGGCAVALVATTVVFAQAPAPAGGGAQVGQAPGAPAGPGRGGRAGGPAGQGRAGGAGRAAGPQNQVAAPIDVAQMISALPKIAPATPKANRRVLVLSRAGGFVHSSIPIAARTIEALGATPVPGELPAGRANQAWTTVITFNINDINPANLAQYDAVFLNNTTGQFLDDADPVASEARRKALLDFVRGGKGLGGIHSATDSYHKGGSPLWQEFNHMIGGSFKFHWNYPTPITLKVDDLDNPINRAFTRVQGGNRVANNVMVVDEVYTFSQDSWSRDRVRTLLSVNYERMPQEIKDQEPANGKRTDGDYGISYIRREGQGRVYVNVLGHDHGIYKMPAMLEHFLAGMQYALGDLEGVDDSPMPLKK